MENLINLFFYFRLFIIFIICLYYINCNFVVYLMNIGGLLTFSLKFLDIPYQIKICQQKLNVILPIIMVFVPFCKYKYLCTYSLLLFYTFFIFLMKFSNHDLLTTHSLRRASRVAYHSSIHPSSPHLQG